MAASGAGIIDPTKTAKYPVVLSDALLGMASKEAFTGIRYNHKPTLSSDTAPSTARIKQSVKDGSFNLGFDDNGDRYQYNGVRTSDDGNFVLIFDPKRKVFVLHKVDSMFHMNVTKTPNNTDVDSLREEFPHLEVKGSGSKKASGRAGPGRPGPKGKAGPGAAKEAPKPQKKVEKEKPVPLMLPDPPKPAAPKASREVQPAPEEKKKRRSRSPAESEEEDDDDDDGGLTIEYPGGNPGGYRPRTDFSPAFPAQMNRRFSEFVRDGGIEEADEDADAEFEDDNVEEEEEEDEEDGALAGFKLPSPVNNAVNSKAEQPTFEWEVDGDANGDMDADGDDDLAAEFERELANQMDAGSDSSVSEED